MPPVQRPANRSEPAIRTGESDPYGGLRLPQIRVLLVLSKAKGPLTRGKINDLVGNKTVVVTGRAIGYSDPDKRTVFEQTKDGGGSPGHPCPSLLTLGYVKEYPLSVPEDGINELVVEITKAGRQALEALGDLDLPPLRD